MRQHIPAKERLRFLDKYFSAARTELMWRVKHRDDWFKLHVLSQIVLFALASGQLKVEAIAPAVAPVPELAILAGPLAFVFACLYFVEDRLVGLLSSYAGEVSFAEQALTGGQTLLSWDRSTQHTRYYRRTFLVRYVVQFICFVGVPVLVFAGVPPGHWRGTAAIWVSGASALGAFGILLWSLFARLSDFRASNAPPIAVNATPEDLKDADRLTR